MNKFLDFLKITGIVIGVALCLMIAAPFLLFILVKLIFAAAIVVSLFAICLGIMWLMDRR